MLVDPGLQQCFDNQLGTPLGPPYADQVELIRCNFLGVKTLEGIEVFTGLLQLDLAFNDGISNIEPVLSLPVLNRLGLSDCGLGPDSTEILSKLTTPIELFIDGNNLGDISVFSRTTNLTALHAAQSNITAGIAELTTLTNATTLDFRNNPQSPCDDLRTLHATFEPDVVLPFAEDVRSSIDCAP